MNHEREVIYLAALLHDIGKFMQRADPSGASSSKLLSQNIKNLEGSISPKHWQSGKYTHKHVLWTAQAIENMQQHFGSYLKLTDGWTYDRLLRLSAAHHAPDANNLLERILQKADHYSSGIDRDKQEGTGWKDAAEEADEKWDSFKRTRMRSVFESISLKESNRQESYKKKLPLKAISTGADFFPIDAGQADEANYEQLCKEFEQELHFIQNKTLRSFNESLLFLLEKYTSRIPSSTQHLPDVSLFDHLKTTAAFALSLYDYVQNQELKDLPDVNEKPFALVGGAISGIQKFIYSIVAKDAAKNLKGRSFYLQLLVDNVVQLVVDELGLQSGNIVYASGGGFYLIAPNTHALPEKLKALEKKIAEKLFEYHGTDLYLSLDFAPFGEQEIFNQTETGENIGKVWQALGEQLSAKKGQRFASVLEENFNGLFEPIPVSPETRKDAITGEELGDNFKPLDDNRDQLVNWYTWQQIMLGKELKSADYWIISKERLEYFPKEIYCIDPIGLGLYNYLVDEATLAAHEDKLKASADNVRVIYFNKGNFLEPLHKGINNIYGFAWYGGNDYPENQFGNPKVFEELAGVILDKHNYRDDAKRASGPELTRLGVLRMDVDNLGAIFRRGLHPARRSFSRYSTLSRSMDWFFKGYLNTIWRDNADYEQYTQIIYSGGDDLFIVGKWDVLIKMAADIQAAFKKWVCENPELTLSGGMASIGPRFPILKSAAYSEMMEKAAKKHVYGAQEKNAFAFISYTPQHDTEALNIALNWETEYPYLNRLKDQIKTLIQGDLSEGFSSAIYNLMQQAKMKKNKDGLFYPNEHRVSWLAAYQFKRNSDGKSEAVKEFFREWAKAIMTGKPPGEDAPKETQYHALQYLALAGRWAALEERSVIKTKQPSLQTT